MTNEKRLIDANKLMVCHINVGTVMFPKMEAFVRAEDIKAAPIVDAVEVVRCKNCDWYRKHVGSICVNPKCVKSWHGVTVPPDHFCSYGERREGE